MKMFKNSFWGILKKGDWNNENTDEVFEPIINFLVNHKDQYIFDFHDLMSEFLYELDRKEIYEHSINQEQFNEEDFLNKLAAKMGKARDLVPQSMAAPVNTYPTERLTELSPQQRAEEFINAAKAMMTDVVVCNEAEVRSALLAL